MEALGHICTHEHDEICGYVGPTEGAECQFVCEICNFIIVDWTWVDYYGILLPVSITATLKTGYTTTLLITWKSFLTVLRTSTTGLIPWCIPQSYHGSRLVLCYSRKLEGRSSNSQAHYL